MKINEFMYVPDEPADENTPENPCWDCGSTIPGHHTELCDLAEPHDVRDLPSHPGTQYWTGEYPK